jgi:site-specific DNA-methyltransferase (adenine-specific)
MTNPIHREDNDVKIVCADSLDYLKTLPENSIDSIVTDPPYEIGFMGRGWDSTGIAYNVELWRECLRVLKPGGHALVFGATRTYHRVAVAIEDAGFEIRDSIHWMYGSGFPKSHNIGKSLDREAGAEREVVDTKPQKGAKFKTWDNPRSQHGFGSPDRKEFAITAPATDAAKTWSGWGTALKPAHEPIVVARKPLDGTVANNVLTWGVGGLNIDGNRVGSETITQRQKDMTAYHGNKLGTGMAGFVKQTGVTTTTSGRFPANILLTHNVDCEIVGEASDTFGVSDGLEDYQAPRSIYGNSKQLKITTTTNTTPVYRCSPGCPVKALDEQSGESKSTVGAAEKPGAGFQDDFVGGRSNWNGIRTEYIDVGGASRFFTNLDHDDEQLTEVPFIYSGKASKKERPIHPETGKGHPTVKPLSVMRWLIKLVTPAGGVVLDPFAGSGATVEAALLDGYRVIGIDITEDHMPLIDARIDRFRSGLSPVKKPKVAKSVAAAAKGNSKARKQATAATAVQEETLFDDLEETS